MADEYPTKTIIVDRRSAVGIDAEVSFGINGVTQTVPVGVPTEVREDLLEALTNSDRTFTVVDTGEDAAGASLAGGSAAAGDTGMDGDAQQDPAGGRMGANDRLAPHVDKDTTGFEYAPDPGAFGAEGGDGKAAIPGGALTAEQQGEANGTDGGSDELGGEKDKLDGKSTLVQDGEVKKAPELEKAETSSSEDSSAFNPESVITGTVPEVKAKLANLTGEQLDQVAKAEADREQPRSGVKAAIDEAKAKLAE